MSNDLSDRIRACAEKHGIDYDAMHARAIERTARWKREAERAAQMLDPDYRRQLAALMLAQARAQSGYYASGLCCCCGRPHPYGMAVYYAGATPFARWLFGF